MAIKQVGKERVYWFTLSDHSPSLRVGGQIKNLEQNVDQGAWMVMSMRSTSEGHLHTMHVQRTADKAVRDTDILL